MGLTFETGMTSGALSIFLSRIGYKFYKSCLSSTENGTPSTMNRYVYKITENIVNAENQNGNFGIFNKNSKSQNGQQQQNWKNEAQRLLEERKDFVKKVEQVEGLNRRYREAIFQIEKSYNEEHKLKKIEQKRLKNLTKFMEQCSVIVANRKDKLDDTLSRAV